MEKKKIVVALGGNALGKNLPEQMNAVRGSVKPIADLIEEGHEVVVSHGNGPQVGMIQEAFTLLARENPEKYDHFPLSVCTAMSQGYIGYDLQNMLREELANRGIIKDVASCLTQVEVDPADPAFREPTKPIGAVLTKEEADKLAMNRHHVFKEDAGRGYRRVVASPKPKAIVEIGTIRALADSGHVVIAAGG
ncbi:MAG: carbamate kinase, partial [Mogibacterium sp.]|nr:carbamate kinase [Mogibacterium sp.]